MLSRRWRNWTELSVLVCVLLFFPVAAHAQSSPGDEVPARLRHFEGTVSVQRAAVGQTEPALANLPVGTGDRVWTEADGRVELVFNDGSTVWLDNRSTIDVVSLHRRAGDAEAILRLWSGSVYLQRPPPARGATLAGFRIDSPAGSAVLARSGVFRVDVDEEQRLWLSVYDGTGDLVAGGLTQAVRSGEQTYAEVGSAPAHPASFNTAELDDFAAWRAGLLAEAASTERYVREVSDYVPREIVHHVVDLRGHGSWFYHDAYGSWAWRPYVSVGWTPYRHGRWVYSWGGWVWVPISSWGYVTVHYGRWHYSGGYGWCWYPGRTWGPAWVHWYVSPRYVGWVPLNYYNRPAVSINFYGDIYGDVYIDGRYPTPYADAYRRGVTPQGSSSGRAKAVKGLGYTSGLENAWTFVPERQFRTADVGRVAMERSEVASVVKAQADSTTMMSGPLRARNPSRAVPTTRQAVSKSNPAATRMTGTSTGGPVPRPTSASSTSGRSATSRAAVPRATALGTRRPSSRDPAGSVERQASARPTTTARPTSPLNKTSTSTGRYSGTRERAVARPTVSRPSSPRSPTSSASSRSTTTRAQSPTARVMTAPRTRASSARVSAPRSRAASPRSSPTISGSPPVARPTYRSPAVARPTVRSPSRARPSGPTARPTVRPSSPRPSVGRPSGSVPRGGVSRPPSGGSPPRVARPKGGGGGAAPARGPSRSTTAKPKGKPKAKDS